MEENHDGDSSCQRVQENFNPNISKDLEQSLESFTAAAQSSTNEPAEFCKSNPDDCVSLSFSEKDIHDASNILIGTSKDNVEFPSENDSTLNNLDSGLPEDNETIQPTVTQENGSTQVIQLGISEENGLAKINQLGVSEEDGSAKINQLGVSEENGSAKVNQLGVSEENGSTKVNQLGVSEENGSTKVNQLGVSEENESTKVVQSDMSRETEFLKTATVVPEETRSTKLSQETTSLETESTEESSLAIMQASNLKDAIHQLDLSDFNSKAGGLFFSSGTVKTRIISDTNSSKVSEIPSEKDKGVAVDLLRNENLDTSKNMDNFNSLRDSEEYKNGTHFLVINQSGGGGGYVIATPSPPCTPVISDLKMPPLSFLTTNTLKESPQPSNPTEDAETPKDISSKISLSTLVSILVDWVNKGMDRAFNRPQMASVEEFINYADKELKYELDVLKQMKLRVDTLMRAIERLPDPYSLMPLATSVQSNSIRDDLKEAGMKAWRLLDAMEADATEDYEKFFSLCHKDLPYNDEFDKNLELMALNIISNSYVKASESLSVLGLDIEIFRHKIREFCSEFDRYL